jgi:hypothetical protein
MTDTSLLEQIRAVDWASFAQPEWNKPGEVFHAFELVLAANNPDSSENAYNRIMFAIGNSHGGTYYPVIVPALPFLAKILENENPWARATVTSALADLYGSFEPEFDRPDYHTTDKLREELYSIVQKTIPNFCDALERLAANNEIASHDARELLQDIHNRQA